MNCADAIEQLGPYLDGELSTDDRAGLDAHLADCEWCRSELDALGRLTASLAIPPTAPVPDALWSTIERRLYGEAQSSPDAKPPLARESSAPVPDRLCTAIEQRLDGGVQVLPDANPPGVRESSARPVWLRRAPLALAASVILAVGLGIIGLSQSGSQAAAATRACWP